MTLLIRSATAAFVLAAVAATAAPVPKAPSIAAKGYILIDADTEQVLVEFNSEEALPPASLTKIMTSYTAAVELEQARIGLDDDVPVSVKAWRTPGSKMFIREGTKVKLLDLLKGVIIQSGNDASVAVAEYVAGSEDAFAGMMNQHAVELGMVGSSFYNSTGLPAEGHVSTAKDLALLTRAMIQRFPEHYGMYAEREFTFGDIRQPNRNRLLWRDRTVDGVKTGHTEAAGYCLVASALRDGMRLISVVMGTQSDEARMRETQKLMQYGFRYFETQKIYDTTAALKSVEVFYGEAENLSLGVEEPMFLTFPRGRYDDLASEIDVPSVIEAPIGEGQAMGEIRVSLDGEVIGSSRLVAREAVAESGIFSRMADGIYLFFSDLF